MDIYCQRLKAPNDSNGNPRRLTVVYGRHTGEPLAIIDEGYAGTPSKFLDATGQHTMEPTWLPEVNVSAKEYRAWKQHKACKGPEISWK